jgi:diguanylate cyclase (GGDEF)-like protein
MDGFAELRTRHVQNAIARIEQVTQALDRLAADHGNTGLTADLQRHFHGFAGVGTTYGFPVVTETARKAEYVLRTNEGGGRVDAALIRELRAALDTIQREYANADRLSAAPSPPATQVAAPTRKVMVAGGEPWFHQSMIRALEDEGFTTSLADDRDAVIDAFEGSDPPFALIADLSTSGADVYALIDSIRALPAGENAPAFVVSPSNAFLDKVEAIRCGASGYFEKPVDPVAITRRLRQAIASSEDVQRRILSVEDDPDQADFIRLVLESAGYSVRICADPAMFETDLTSFDPDLLLLDINLGSMNGYELAQFTRQNERYATLPIVFLSSDTELRSRVRSVEAGGDDHLSKPLSPPLLLSSVAARIERATFLRTLLERDGLTGLLTHTAFMERLKTRLAKHRRSHGLVSLVMIDVDHFKGVNDTYGHPTGDRVLSSLASFLRRRLRQSDSIGRYGGEEFALLIEDLDEKDTCRLVTSLLQTFGAIEHRATDGQLLKVTFSAGVATLGDDGSVSAWSARADRALYAAKARGRNQAVAASDI